MISDKEKWDKKHKENPPNTTPLELLKNYIHLAQDCEYKVALDIACGMGRNSYFMRDNGFVVDSIDISSTAIESLKNQHNINAICVDLDDFIIEENKYALVVNSFFLDRRLFPQITKSLKKNGILIFETFVINKPNNTPININHMLHKNELLRAFLNLDILFYEESLLNKNDDSTLVARLVARG